MRQRVLKSKRRGEQVVQSEPFVRRLVGCRGRWDPSFGSRQRSRLRHTSLILPGRLRKEEVEDDNIPPNTRTEHMRQYITDDTYMQKDRTLPSWIMQIFQYVQTKTNGRCSPEGPGWGSSIGTIGEDCSKSGGAIGRTGAGGAGVV